MPFGKEPEPRYRVARPGVLQRLPDLEQGSARPRVPRRSSEVQQSRTPRADSLLRTVSTRLPETRQGFCRVRHQGVQGAQTLRDVQVTILLLIRTYALTYVGGRIL